MLGPRTNKEVDEQAVGQLQGMIGPQQGIPQEIRDNIRFAEQKLRKMGLMKPTAEA